MSDVGRREALVGRAHRWTTEAIRVQGASSVGRGLAIVAALLGVSWMVSYLLGGAGRVPPHWFYVPILVAGARFGLAGAAATGVLAGLIAGPLLPLDVATGTAQQPLDWAGRLGFFLGIGLVMGAIIVRLKASLERELALTREQSDFALGQSKQRTHTIIETAHEAVVGMDATGRIIDWNRAAEATFGWSKEEATGRIWADTLIPERHRDAHRKGLEDFLTTGQGPALNTRMEVEALHREGHEFPVELTISALRVGGSVSFIAFVHDITERKKVEEALRSAKADAERAREEAEHANLAKSDFLSRISHELRTPLNAILGFAQLLEMDELTSEQHQATEHVIKGGRHLLELINEVLDISRIESGQLGLSLEPVRVADVVRDCIDLIRPLAQERGIELRVELSGDTSCEHVSADRQRLGQVLLNLLSNGVKYNVDKGVVTVTSTRVTGDRLRLGVIDTGPGIRPEEVHLLFTPFERLGADQTTVEGTGLGLALCKRLVDAMGGEMLVDTTTGKGTTFWVELTTATPPVTEEVGQLAPEEVGVPVTGLRTVLYVEDNLSNFELIERVLARRPNVELIPAMTGDLGLDLARQHVPDLILLDLHLPDVRGDEVLVRLRTDPKTSHIPVLVLSADATPGEIKRLLASGAEDYLTKPLDVPSFLRALDRIFEQRDLQRSP
jgi:PAS domain S-box-containing protein